VRRPAAAALAIVALALAGCGNGGGGSLPDGASRAPAEAPGFVSVKTDFSSEQWKNMTRLARRFPATPKLLERLQKQAGGLDLEREVKPALGPELDLVWLDFADGGSNVIALTKPSSIAKLKALLGKGASSSGEAITTRIGDWVAVADTQAKLDRFKELAEGDKLDGDRDFKDGFRKLDPDSFVRAWVRGGLVQAALDRELENSGATPRITRDVGELRGLAASASAESDGVALEFDGLIDPPSDPATFNPSLADSFPPGAVLYVSAASLDDPLRIVLRMVGESNPGFDTQLEQVQSVVGIRLDEDVYPLLEGESAVAVYSGGRIPPVLFLQKVDDEKKADTLLRRFSAIAQLSGSVDAQTVRLGGRAIQRLAFSGSGVVVYDGVVDGKLFITNEADLALRAIRAPASSLADDRSFQAARDAAGLPDEVVAFAYADLQDGLPFVFRLAEQSGRVIPPEARANTKPLRRTLVYLVKDGEALRLSGFTTIK
jgi:predicted small lipoprotein YifL